MHGGEDIKLAGKRDDKTVKLSCRNEVFDFLVRRAGHCTLGKMQSDGSSMSLIGGRAKKSR